MRLQNFLPLRNIKTIGDWNGMAVEIGKVYSNPMLRAFKSINEEPTKKLRIFDFDDTLVKTNSSVYVKDEKTGKVRKMTPGEYAVYEPKPTDKFDFSEFDKVIQPQEIKGVTNLLRRIAKSEGERKIVILTARGVYQPVKDYLQDIGLSGIYVVALGDSDPEKKAEWIENKIKTGYNDIFFIDDSHKNVNAVGTLSKKYPNVKLRVQQVKHQTPKPPPTFSQNENILLSKLIPKNK